jgi:hypothetical protein
MSIPFTQYLRPDGRKAFVTIDMPAEVEAVANELIKNGYHFDVEELQTGVVSMTCEKSDDVISIQLCSNGPEVVEAVTKLVRTADERHREGWRPNQDEDGEE